jgi:metallophosphoesterase (TIGR00282 family)
VKILFLGDIVGKAGRRVILELISGLKDRHGIDLVIANVENAAGGNGITLKLYYELIENGIDFLTSGNHIWDNKEYKDIFNLDPKLIRPANYPAGTPGMGCGLITLNAKPAVAVLNLAGRVFMPGNLDCPFRCADALLPELRSKAKVIIIDFHAEATSEKVALGHYLDGRASAVIGTHTHVQTADEKILPQGTAYITDVGMCGASDSVIGVKKEIIIKKFLTQLPHRFEPSKSNPCLQGLVLDIDEDSGKARSIERIYEYL